MRKDVLVVDDEADIRDLIGGVLEDEGYAVRGAANSEQALALVRERQPSAVVLDVWLQGSRHDGLELLSLLRDGDPDLPVVMISGHGTIETAVAALRKGAYDFIEKPFKSDRLLVVMARAIEASRLKREVKSLRERTDTSNDLIGRSSAVGMLRQTIAKVAPTRSRVLITGPAGAGKELIARLLHDHSTRASGPFVAINAASLSPERLEAEMFGEEDAQGLVRKAGVFEQAHTGTLYLDEVSDMPRETQGKILRLLVEQRFTRLGGATPVQVDVRVVSSTTRDLLEEIANGRFREDLYHRLNVVPLRAPSLSERREDISELVEHFIVRLAASSGLPPRTIGEDVLAALQAHEWPGNVRQLRNNVERLLILASGEPGSPITLEHLPEEVSPAGEANGRLGSDRMIGLPLRDAREQFEREYLTAQINRFGGNISRTAAFIGMERSALHRKLKSLGVGAQTRANGHEHV